MTGYSFDTFRTDDRNGDAIRISQEIAELRYTGDTPVVLVAPEGGGKSHLLWSIVKQLRAHDARTSLALVMAREFPDRVRQLAAYPAPIQNGRPAVLLIDELERFEHDQEDLEDLVRVFLQNGHPVVLASRVHPDQLRHFGESFHALLNLGQVITLDRPATLPPATADESSTLRATCDTLRMERDALEQKLAERAPQLAGLSDLQQRLAAAESERDRLAAAAADTSAMKQLQREHAEALETIREDLASVVVDRDAARDERDLLEKQLANRAEGAQELLRLTNARDQALEAQMRAEAALAESEADHGQTAARLTTIENQAGDFFARLQDERYAWNEGAQALEQALERLQQVLATRRGPDQRAAIDTLETELGDARALATSYRVQLDQERAQAEAIQSRLDEDLQALEAARAEADAEVDRAHRLLDEARAQQATGVFELEKARRQSSLASVELDALRHEAATQVARANIQAGEMENRVHQLQDALDILRETGHAAAQDTFGVQQTVEQLVRAAQTLEARLHTFNNIALPCAEADEVTETLQPILFEPSAIKSAAETLDTLAREWKALEPDADEDDEDEDGPAAVGQSAV